MHHSPGMRRLVALLLLLAVVLVAGVAWAADSAGLMSSATDLQGRGPLGAALFLGIYAVGSLLALPASWFQGGASFLYGPWLGIPLAWLASTTFGFFAFELARGRLRGWAERKAAGSGRLQAIDRAAARHGAWFVALMRLSPMSPYNLVSYLLGLTAVSRKQFVLGTLAGGLVPVLVWGTIGAQLTDIAALVSGEATGPAWTRTAGLVVTLVASVGIAIFVKRALAKVESAPA